MSAFVGTQGLRGGAFQGHDQPTRGDGVMQRDTWYWTLVGMTILVGVYYALRADTLGVNLVCGTILVLMIRRRGGRR